MCIRDRYLASVLMAGPKALGIIEGIAEATSSLLKLFAGVLADKTASTKPWVVGGYSLAAIARPLMAFATAWPVSYTHLDVYKGQVYADAEDPGFWHRLKLEGLRAVILAMPDPEAKHIATQQLRRHGFQGLIGAISHHPEEEAALRAAGADMTFLAFNAVSYTHLDVYKRQAEDRWQ